MQTDRYHCYSLFWNISKLAKGDISIFCLVSVAEEADFSLVLSETQKTGFVESRPICDSKMSKPNEPLKLHLTLCSKQYFPVWFLLGKTKRLDVYVKSSASRITKALIRLRGCAGWSAPLLFANH